jgi:hypothetical protein
MCVLSIRLSSVLTHGIATHLDTMGVVNQPVEDAVGYGRIADLFKSNTQRRMREFIPKGRKQKATQKRLSVTVLTVEVPTI